jgi:integrase/recombinase XerD
LINTSRAKEALVSTRRHWPLRKVRGKGDKTVLIPLPPAVARAIDRAVSVT